MMLNLSDYHHIITGDETPQDLELNVAGFISSRYQYFKDARREVEDIWLEAWSIYNGSPDAVDHQREQTLGTVGDVNNDWRHRLNTGKGFQVIETVHAYLMGALFPNREWFDLTPTNPGYAQEARIIRKYIAKKFKQGKFRVAFEKYLRQLLVCGFSVVALPWRCESIPYKYNVSVAKQPDHYETSNGLLSKKRTTTKVVESRVNRNHPEFECLDIFDVYIDPTANDANESDLIRRVKKTRADIITSIQYGKYQGITAWDVVNLKPYKYSERTKRLTQFQGVNVDNPFCMDDTVEVVEYWGNIYTEGVTIFDCHATVIGERLVAVEPNPFWAGKPFVVGTVTEVTTTPYSIGLLQPNLGLLHQLNIITNQRCDNLELAVDEMWTLKQNSSLQPSEVFTAPGKVFLVDDHDDLRPVQRGAKDFVVSYQEAGLLEQTIDGNSGTGNLISANAARSGERVTAAEIQAVRDAGGNRLSNIHRHIEETSLIEILNRVYRSAQQFVTEPEMVRVTGSQPGQALYLSVDNEALNKGYDLEPIGADHVTDKTKYVRERQELIGFVSQIPQLAQRLNYEAILNDILLHSSFDDPYAYIVQPQQQQQPVTPEQQMLPPEQEQVPAEQTNPMYDIGGVSLQNAVDANLQADGGADLINFTTGVQQ